MPKIHSIEAAEDRWLGLVEFPGYEVSDWGQVGSHFPLGGKVRTVDTSCRLMHILTPIVRFGYRCFGLRHRSGKIKIVRGAVLVLTAFVSPRPPNQVARHLNDVRDDDRLENLTWGTQAENMKDAVKNGFQYAHGEKHGHAKLTDDQIRLIRSMQGRTSQRAIADLFGIRQSTVSRICSRERRRHTL